MKAKSKVADDQDEDALSPAQNWALLLVLLSIIPWALIWVNYLAPAFGLGGMSMKFTILAVIAGPALLWTVLHYVLPSKPR